MMKYKFQKGFIAVTSAIIISILLLAITLAISMSGYFARFNVLDSESKERSMGLAEACADSAILNLSQDSSYSGGEIIINSSKCTVVSADAVSGVIKTQAEINKAFTNLRVTVDPSDFQVQSWQECTNLTSSTSSC